MFKLYLTGIETIRATFGVLPSDAFKLYLTGIETIDRKQSIIRSKEFKLYLTGIETVSRLPYRTSVCCSNCTLQELKRFFYWKNWLVTKSSNCTLQELKQTIGRVSDGDNLFKLYLTGIETSTNKQRHNNFRPVQIVPYRNWNEATFTRCLYSIKRSNCNLLELKRRLRSHCHWRKFRIQIAPYWNWNAL